MRTWLIIRKWARYSAERDGHWRHFEDGRNSGTFCRVGASALAGSDCSIKGSGSLDEPREVRSNKLTSIPTCFATRPRASLDAIPGGFDYSRAMRKAGVAGLVWDQATLDKFLENPMRFLPGTRMGYAGIKNAQERPRARRSDRLLEGGERWFKAPLNLRRPKRTQRLPVFARAHTSNAIEGEAKQRRVGIGGVDDVGR